MRHNKGIPNDLEEAKKLKKVQSPFRINNDTVVHSEHLKNGKKIEKQVNTHKTVQKLSTTRNSGEF
jgi:hypothetical protein